MNTLTGEILTLPKMSGSVSTPNSLSGNVGAKTINIGGKGDDGATFIPYVSDDCVLSWTNDKDLPNPEPVNIKGTKGDKGDPGKDGADYILTDADKTEIAEMAAELVEVPDSGGNVDFQIGETLKLENGILSVNTTNNMEQDNTLPITSAGVFATVGNIEALLKTI